MKSSSPRKQTKELLFEPANPIQRDFITHEQREGMFDGGIGNGKTTGGLMRLLILAREFPKSRWVIARQVYKDLMNTTRPTFSKVCPENWIKREVKESMTLFNDSEILWLHLDDISDSFLRGLEINGAFISQAEEVAPEMWEFLDSRIGRWNMPEWDCHCPPHIWGDCNPNGHDWIYFRFHPEAVGYLHPDRAYFFGETSINLPILEKNNPGYYAALMKKPETWKRRWVYGSREIFEGQIHPDFKREIHVYNADEFDPYERLDIKCAWGWFDYGLSAPTCMLISASTADNFHFITSEYYKQSSPIKTITIAEHATAIKKATKDNRMPVRGVYADPSIFFQSTRDRKTTVTSVAQEYRECGVYLVKADNNEATSISNLQELLHVDKDLPNPITRERGSPRLFISSRCTNLIEQIQTQRHGEMRNPLTGEKEFTEERAAGIPDHAYDPLRYFANSNVWEAPRKRDQPTIPVYRTTPRDAPTNKGYMQPGAAPRHHSWRNLPSVPMPSRVGQEKSNDRG